MLVLFPSNPILDGKVWALNENDGDDGGLRLGILLYP